MNRNDLIAGLPASLEDLSESEQRVIVLRLVERGLQAIEAEGRAPDDFEAQYLGYALAVLQFFSAGKAFHYFWHAFDPARTSMVLSVPLPNMPQPNQLHERVAELRAAYQNPS